MTLKDHIRHTTQRHPKKSIDQIAEEMGICANLLYKYSLPDKDEVKHKDQATGVAFPLKRLIPLIRATNDFRILDYIEAALGRVAFELPKKRAGHEALHRGLSKSVQEFGELVKAVGDSMTDGKITAEELEQCKTEGQELIQAVAHLIYSLEPGGGRQRK